MAGSFSQELEDLLNPLPKFADPEDEDDEATKARVVERFNEDDDDEDAVGLSALRKRLCWSCTISCCTRTLTPGPSLWDRQELRVKTRR
uniref:Uncharacterized protein n=1 Tax=Lates calcarifer TaxID=8187 RepID=A0A4W6CTN5_LATCA